MPNESVLKKALLEYREIKDASEKVALKKLAEKFPDEFKKILNEAKEENKKSDKSIDDKESNEDKNNTISENNDSNMKDHPNIKIQNTDRDKDFTGDVENETPNTEKNSKDGVAYKESKNSKDKNNGVAYQKDPENIENNIADKKGDNQIQEKNKTQKVNEEHSIENLNVDDEAPVSIDEIENEINSMEDLQNQMPDNNENILGELVDVLKELKDHILTNKTDDVEDKQSIDQNELENAIDEYENKIQYKITDGDNLPDELEGDMDEASGIAHSSSKHAAGDHLPGNEYAKHRHKRYGSPNNINESAAHIKKVNKLKKENKVLKEYVEKFKNIIPKYRDQINEMVTFNTNLSHVNNILINEDVALNHDEKIDVINKFKNIKSIDESVKTYNNILSEQKTKKPIVNENEEIKTDTSVSPSSKQKIDEVTSYSKNSNSGFDVSKMKKLMNY